MYYKHSSVVIISLILTATFIFSNAVAAEEFVSNIKPNEIIYEDIRPMEANGLKWTESIKYTYQGFVNEKVVIEKVSEMTLIPDKRTVVEKYVLNSQNQASFQITPPTVGMPSPMLTVTYHPELNTLDVAIDTSDLADED